MSTVFLSTYPFVVLDVVPLNASCPFPFDLSSPFFLDLSPFLSLPFLATSRSDALVTNSFLLLLVRHLLLLAMHLLLLSLTALTFRLQTFRPVSTDPSVFDSLFDLSWSLVFPSDAFFSATFFCRLTYISVRLCLL